MSPALLISALVFVLVAAGIFVAFAILDKTPWTAAPDIPTVAEAGLPGFESSNWFAIYGPRKLPAAVAQRWNEAVNRYLQTPQAKAYFGNYQQRPVGGSVAAFTEFHNISGFRPSSTIRRLASGDAG